jgi:hypothetical protein
MVGTEGKFLAVVFDLSELWSQRRPPPTVPRRQPFSRLPPSALAQNPQERTLARFSAWLGKDLDWARHRAG